MVESLHYLKGLSLFNYLTAAEILEFGSLPLDEVMILTTVGVVALLSALYIFQRRELAI
ncbi:MAG TPA: hypothetical protein VM050_08385 [Patescibacteria group bacterium]|nr:hypothetical protein [Patescibacteria group bacterium]